MANRGYDKDADSRGAPNPEQLQNAERGGYYNSRGDGDRHHNPQDIKDSEERAASANDDAGGDGDESNSAKNVPGKGRGDGLASDAFDDKNKNDDEDDSDEEQSQGSGKGKRRKRFLTRRKAAAGGAAGVIVAVLFGGFSIVQGPMQFMHLSEILQKPLGGQEDASNERFKGLMRFAKTGNAGETRVTWLGSRSKAKTIERLKNIGFEAVGDSVTGKTRVITIDTSKYSLLEGRTNEEAMQFLSEKYNIPPENINIEAKTNSRGSMVFIDARSDKVAIPMIKDGVGELYKGKNFGKTLTAMKARYVLRFFGNYTFFHPWHKLRSNTEQKTTDFARAQRAKIVEKTEAAKTRAAAAKAKLKPYSGLAGGALTFQLGVCVAKEVAHAVPLLNYENVTAPAEKSALDGIGKGEQPKTGIDVSLSQMGDDSNNFTDKDGKTIWQSAAMRALTGQGGGEDVDKDIKQAFSPDSSTSDIEQGIDRYGGEALCSTAGTIAGGVLGAIAIVVAAPSGGASLAIYSAGVGATMAGTAAAIAGITTYLPKILADKPLINEDNIHSGPFGGTVDALGARAFAGDSYRKSGGVELSTAESDAINGQLETKDKKNFDSKSFMARMFDTSDYRSAVSRAFIDKPSVSPTQLPANVASAFKLSNLGGNVMASLFASKASAADSGHYDWGFPEYGFSRDELDNPLFQDPYDNAEKAAALLDSGAGDYVNRAKACFGVNLLKGDQGWEVGLAPENDNDPDKQVIPATAKYQEANCREGTDNWLRIRFFIFDSRTMDAYACYDGDDDSCVRAGVNGGSSATQSSTSDSTASDDQAPAAGSAAELAQQILDSDKVTLQTNPESSLKAAAKGDPSPAGVDQCGNQHPPVKIDAKLLGFLVDLSKVDSYTITSLTTGAHVCTSNHYKGVAADFGCDIDLAKADAAGKKYGISHNFESCADASPHYHYSIGGG